MAGDQGQSQSELLWAPDAARIAQTRLHAFQQLLVKRGHGPFETYSDLHWFSIDQSEAFWDALWDFGGVIGDKGDVTIAAGERIVDTRFFPQASINVAENILRPAEDPDELLLVGANESGVTSRMTRGDLVARVGRMQEILRSDGVGTGDTVAVWLPNVPDSYVVMLAAVGLGATFVSTSPDFGVDGVLDRFSQVGPKVLVAANGYTYAGRDFDCLDRLDDIVAALPSLEQIYVHNLIEAPAGDADDQAEAEADGDAGASETSYIDLEKSLSEAEGLEPTFERLPFDHPLYVLFSSGTTGKPKPIVHRAGGVLLTHIKEHQLMCDIRPEDRVFFFTTTGWMMWNWLASVMASRAAIIVYDGNPAHPSMTRLFKLVDNVGITLFGTSAKFIESLMKADVEIADRHGLASLRTVASTGSPLSAEGFSFVYDAIHPDVHLASISGGTDLCGCLVGGDPTGAVWSGQLQRPVLGMAIDVYDDVGRSQPAGQRGELVCTAAFPSMPLTFLGDDGDTRYHAAYFERFDNVWHQGDFAEWTPQGGLIIHGRSDATLNPGGVRIGTAEIYAQVEKIADVLEGLVIGQQTGTDTRIVLFVRLRDGVALTDELQDEIRRTIRQGATPRHVPAVIVAVADLPRTRSGKIAEIAVREVVHGRPINNTEALENPQVLDLFVDLPELL